MKLTDYYRDVVDKNDSFTGGWSIYYYGVWSKVITENNYKIVAEVGIGYGTHAKYVLVNNTIDHLYLIDPTKEYPNDTFSSDVMSCEPDVSGENFNELYTLINKELSPWKDTYTWFRKESLTIKNDEIADESLDSVFVDGAHDYYNALADIRFWFKKLRCGGTLLGDDYWIDDVRRAVEDFAKEEELEYILLISVYNIFSFRK
jgi:hypothetical protein